MERIERMTGIFNTVLSEVERAELHHGNLPYIDPVRCAGILVEEAGEVMKEALGATRTYAEPDGTIKDMRKEAIQTAAAAFRIIEGIDEGYIRGVDRRKDLSRE